MRVLAFGTYDKELHPRVAVLLAGLEANGRQVDEINLPLRFSTSERVRVLRHPWLAYRPVAMGLRAWATLLSKSFKQRSGRPDTVVVGYLGHFDVLLARLRFPTARIALDQMAFAADTARDRGVTSRPGLWLLSHLDDLACMAADVIVVDTPEHTSLARPSQRSKVVVAPVGATDEWFAAGSGRQQDHEGPLRVVFFGLFTPLQGTTVLGEALGLLAGRDDISVTMIGHGQDLDATRRLAAENRHVTWIDWVQPAELPGVVASHDVCLGIFGASPKAQRVVPHKVYQGAAAGCAILTSDTEPQKRALGDAGVYVAPGDPAAIASALVEMATDRGRTARIGAATAQVANERFRPKVVVSDLVSALGEPRSPADGAT